MRAVAVAVVGLACLSYGGWLALRQHQVGGWPTTAATVMFFEDGVDPAWGGHWYANPKIQLSYEVDGRAYESSRLNPSPFNYQSQARFQRDTAKFSPGATIAVSYDPEKPAVSYAVNTGVTAAPIVLISVGLVLLLLEAAGPLLKSGAGKSDLGR